MPRSALEEDSRSTPLTRAGERTLHIGRDSAIRISAGHRLRHHDGKCSRPHGHNYEVTVEVRGTLTEEGWIVDKGEVTDIIEQWDHRFLLEQNDPLIKAFESAGDGDALVVLDHPPTAEVMSVILEERMLEAFGDNVSDVQVHIAETSELCTTA